MAGEMASVLKRYFVPWQLNGLFVRPLQKKKPCVLRSVSKKVLLMSLSENGQRTSSRPCQEKCAILDLVGDLSSTLKATFKFWRRVLKCCHCDAR